MTPQGHMRRVEFAAALLMPLLVAGPAFASYDVPWYTFDGGGGHCTGGTYDLFATIGQPDAGTCTGPTYTLLGGFWPFAPSVQPRKGDFDANGVIDFWDFMAFVDCYECSAGDPCYNALADFDDDGDVDFQDFMEFVDVYGT